MFTVREVTLACGEGKEMNVLYSEVLVPLYSSCFSKEKKEEEEEEEDDDEELEEQEYRSENFILSTAGFAMLATMALVELVTELFPVLKGRIEVCGGKVTAEPTMALPKGLIPKEKTGQGRVVFYNARRTVEKKPEKYPSTSTLILCSLSTHAHSPPCILLPDIHRPSPYFSTTLARPRFYVILRLRSSSRKFTGRFFASGDSKGRMEKGQKGENGGSSRRIEKPNLRDLRRWLRALWLPLYGFLDWRIQAGQAAVENPWDGPRSSSTRLQRIHGLDGASYRSE
ncbi:hypothetical protein V1478_012733, partial [Vespula squamosa]